MGTILKWTGGVTAVLSLFLVLQQVNGIVGTWSERREAVSALTRAAALQADSGDFDGAWGLLDEALALEPGAARVQDARVDLAMRWLRDMPDTAPPFAGLVTPLLPSLYVGAVRTAAGARADALAHVGYAQSLLAREGETGLDVDGSFERALEADPDNVFAHAWWGAWLVHNDNDGTYDEPRLTLARRHFDRALEPGERRDWARQVQFDAYGRSNLPEVKVRLIAVVLDLASEGGNLLPADARVLQQVLRDVALRTSERAWQAATAEFTWPEMLRAYQATAGVLPPELAQDRFVLATLHERAGDPDTALAQYRALLPDIAVGSYRWSQDLRDAIGRLDPP